MPGFSATPDSEIAAKRSTLTALRRSSPSCRLGWKCGLLTMVIRWRDITGGEQVVEQGSDMDHGLAQLLGVGLSLLSRNRDCVGCPIVLDHVRVLD